MQRDILPVLLAVALLAGGCTLGKPLAHHAIAYNRAVETAQNEMYLLNVVRASQRMPMHFTAIGSITAGLSYTVSSGSLTVTRSSSNSETASLPGFSYSNKPTVQISVLDTEEFMRGTLTPVDAEVFQYYWEHGWNLDVLLYLLVERFEVNDLAAESLGLDDAGCGDVPRADPKLHVADNDPEHAAHFCRFRLIVDRLRQDRCAFGTVQTQQPLGLVDAPTKTGDYVAARAAGLSFGPKEDGGKKAPLLTTAETHQLVCGATRSAAESAAQQTIVGAFGHYDRVGEMVEEIEDESIQGAGRPVPEERPEISLVLRSPQGVLYYLGEVARVWNDAGLSDAERVSRLPVVHQPGDHGGFRCPEGGTAERCVPLFLVRQPRGACDEAVVEVEYDGAEHMIPRRLVRHPPAEAPALTTDLCHPGRSMQALTLAAQLVSLQKSGDDLPGTAVVRLVGD